MVYNFEVFLSNFFVFTNWCEMRYFFIENITNHHNKSNKAIMMSLNCKNITIWNRFKYIGISFQSQHVVGLSIAQFMFTHFSHLMTLINNNNNIFLKASTSFLLNIHTWMFSIFRKKKLEYSRLYLCICQIWVALRNVSYRKHIPQLLKSKSYMYT